MQQYIDISPHHDTLGSDTVWIHIHVVSIIIIISSIMIYQCINIKTLYFYVQTDAVAVASFTALQLFSIIY